MKNLNYFLLIQLLISVLGSCKPGAVKEVNNILLPDKLLVADHVPFDSLFMRTAYTGYIDSGTGPVFSYKPVVDFPELLTQKALEGKISISNPDNIVDYCEQQHLTPMSDTMLRVRLGEEEMMTTMVIGDSTIVQTHKLPIDLHQMTSLYTVEEWCFSAEPLFFSKKVNLVMPVRRYIKGDLANEYRFMKLFCMVNPATEPVKNLELMAHVEYEFVFNQPGAFLRSDFKPMLAGMLQPDDCLTDMVVSAYNSPWFNVVSQQIMVNELLNQVFEGKAHAVDYPSGKELTADEARKRVFTERMVTYVDEDGNEVVKAIENDRTAEIKSVIFIEDWFYNPQTMGMVKKITGIAPVFYSMDYDHEELQLIRREVAFNILMPE